MTDFSEDQWRRLMQRISSGRCTPFLGAGASFGAVPLGGVLAEEWANKTKYPLSDNTDLSHVAQYVAVTEDAMAPKEWIQRYFAKLSPPDFEVEDEPHGVLAELPLPVYITTNYDDFMVRALRKKNKAPNPALCSWNKSLQQQEPLVTEAAPTPTAATPLVYHLHGQSTVPESIVVTEDDYLDFLVNISRNRGLIPPRVERAFSNTSLLFMGYRLADTNFRVLFRMLVEYVERSIGFSHISVQLAPGDEKAPAEERASVRKYLDQYFGKLNIQVYWGDSRKFAIELRQRWREFQKQGGGE